MSSFKHAKWLIPTAVPLVAVAFTVVPAIGPSAAAAAQSSIPVPGAPMQVAPGAGPLAQPATTVISGNWSGYAVTGSTYTHVSTSVVVPKVTCTATESAAAMWVGLDGYSDKTVEQTGFTEACFGGLPEYLAWYEAYPQAPVYYENTVLPGDVIKESAVATSATSFALTISDTTQGWTHTTTQTVKGAKRASAEVIAEAPSTSTGPVPLADFGTTAFTKAKVDGTAIGNLHPVTIDMSNGATLEDTTSALTKGKNFTVTWLNSGAS
jgi:hypothetical protein